MNRVRILKRELETLDFITQRLPPEELVKQITLWINGVTSTLEILDLERERVVWNNTVNDRTPFYLEDETFALRIETIRSVLESIIEANRKLEEEFVSSTRIAELKSISSTNYDLSKLINLCNEINICYANDCLFATAMLSRALLDHIPPLFGFGNFDQMANNYSWGKSKQAVINHLNNSSREISNNLIHTMVSQKTDIPTRTRVNCSDGIDIVLAEIVKILTLEFRAI